jgi:hypothetical protein
MKHRISISIAVLLLVILSTGCIKSPDPIERIALFKASDKPGIPSTAFLADPQKDPMPDSVWEFSSHDKIFFAVRSSKDLKENILFTQYTFFNIGTSAEFKVGLPEQLGPFEPGQLPLIAFDDPWPVPTETGHYEFRVYLGNRVVAKALFNIRG